MKHLKLFTESIEDEPKTGDYVICRESDNENTPQILANFINNNIGKITSISKDIDIFNLKKQKTLYKVQYKNIPNNILTYFQSDETMDTQMLKIRPMIKSEILYYSKNKTEVENYLITNIIADKYNL